DRPRTSGPVGQEWIAHRDRVRGAGTVPLCGARDADRENLPLMSIRNGLVQRLWNYCNVLRDDGLSYGDYLEQLTYLLFLKMADEQTKPPFDQSAFVPEELDWQSLLARDGDELEVHYRHLLDELGRRSGMLGIVFRKAQ